MASKTNLIQTVIDWLDTKEVSASKPVVPQVEVEVENLKAQDLPITKEEVIQALTENKQEALCKFARTIRPSSLPENLLKHGILQRPR
jgi:hypothetical protein